MTRLRSTLAMLDRRRLTRREWGSVAVHAAKRAGLCKPDVDSLRLNLRNEFALMARPRRSRR
jgi:hypothetical protein